MGQTASSPLNAAGGMGQVKQVPARSPQQIQSMPVPPPSPIQAPVVQAGPGGYGGAQPSPNQGMVGQARPFGQPGGGVNMSQAPGFNPAGYGGAQLWTGPKQGIF
jgi:hypothetical protein